MYFYASTLNAHKMIITGESAIWQSLISSERSMTIVVQLVEEPTCVY